MAYLCPEGSMIGRMRTIWKAEVVHGESFRGVFTVFLKMKSGHWALEACRGVSLKRSKLAFCFCFRAVEKRQLEKKSGLTSLVSGVFLSVLA